MHVLKILLVVILLGTFSLVTAKSFPSQMPSCSAVSFQWKETGHFNQETESYDLQQFEDSPWVKTELTGQYILSARITKNEQVEGSIVVIKFNQTGKQLLQAITTEHVGDVLGMFIGSELASAPTIQSKISYGTVIITGPNATEARMMVQKLNASRRCKL